METLAYASCPPNSDAHCTRGRAVDYHAVSPRGRPRDLKRRGRNRMRAFFVRPFGTKEGIDFDEVESGADPAGARAPARRVRDRDRRRNDGRVHPPGKHSRRHVPPARHGGSRRRRCVDPQSQRLLRARDPPRSAPSAHVPAAREGDGGQVPVRPADRPLLHVRPRRPRGRRRRARRRAALDAERRSAIQGQSGLPAASEAQAARPRGADAGAGRFPGGGQARAEPRASAATCGCSPRRRKDSNGKRRGCASSARRSSG